MALTHFACPSCSQKLTADSDTLSRRMRCPRCGSAFCPIDTVGHDEPLPALIEDDISEPSAEEAPAPAPGEPASATEEWLSAQASPEIKAAEPSVVFSFDAIAAATAPEREAKADRPEPRRSDRPEAPALQAEEVPESEAPSRSQRGKGGTVVLDDKPRTEPSLRKRLARWEAALAGPSDQLLGVIARRVRGRAAAAASIGAPALALLFLVLLGVSDSAFVRWLVGIVAFGLAWLVLAVALAMVVTRRARAATQPPPRGIIAAGLAVPGALAALLTGTVALSSSPSESERPLPPVAARIAAASASGYGKPAPKPHVDDKLERDKRDRSGNGSLYVPPHFAPDGSEFDLLVHFHGSVTVVEQSVNAAKLNALVHVISLEKGKSYWRKFGAPGSLQALIDQIENDVMKRGLPDAKVRRVAVSSWSIGYGAITQILSHDVERIDAVLVHEGLVAGWVDDNKRDRVDPNKIAPFVRLAELAVDDKKLFAVTHSNTKTRDYASTRTVTDAILEEVALKREPAKGAPPKPKLEAAVKLFPEGPHWLQNESVAHKGGLHILGYKGEMPDGHVAHLAQMSVTLLPILADRWK